MRSTSVQSTLKVLAIGLTGWLVANVAKADVTVTETGTITLEAGSSTTLVGQPYSLATTFNPSDVTGGGQCLSLNPAPCEQYALRSGSTIFMTGSLSTTEDQTNSQAAELLWYPSPTTSGAPASLVVHATVGSGFSFSAITSNPAIPVPNPVTTTGSFSTTVPASANAVAIDLENDPQLSGSGIDVLGGNITNLTITSAPSPSPSLYVTLALGRNPSPETQMEATATVSTMAPACPASLSSALCKVYSIPLKLPAGTQTLQQAAADLGFVGFDWIQEVTNWPTNTSLYAASDPTKTTPITTANGPFYDPVAGGYLNMTLPDPNAVPPYYYNLDDGYFYNGGAGPLDPWAVAANINNYGGFSESTCNAQAAVLGSAVPGSSLCFEDTPEDPNLTSLQLLTNDIPMFTTALVGLVSCNSLGPGACIGLEPEPLLTWSWEDSYDGGSGGISYTANPGPADPGGS